MDTNHRKVFLAKLDKDLEGENSPYHFKLCFGAGRWHHYRAVKKTGHILKRWIPGPASGLRPFVGSRRIA